MGSYLNLIGSFIIGGLFLLTINRYHSSFNQNSNEKLLEVITIQKSSAIIKLVEHDFNRMGFGIPTDVEHPNVQAIKNAGSDFIYFYLDIDPQGSVDSLRYYYSSEDKTLNRVFNNQSELAYTIPGVTRFQLKYFDVMGNETTDFIQMRTFEITLKVEDTIAYDENYPTFFWQTQITPPCIARY